MNVKHTVANHLPVQESPKARQLGYPSFNGFKAVLPRRTKVAIALCLSDGIGINLLYDTVYVYFSIVNVLNRLSETVKFFVLPQNSFGDKRQSLFGCFAGLPTGIG